MLKINSENKIVYLAGDFNINLLENDTNTINHIDNLFVHSFQPVITKTTRIVPGKSATLIDNIYCNIQTCKSPMLSGIFIQDISDHYPIFCNSNFKSFKSIQAK